MKWALASHSLDSAALDSTVSNSSALDSETLNFGWVSAVTSTERLAMLFRDFLQKTLKRLWIMFVRVKKCEIRQFYSNQRKISINKEKEP